MGCGASGAVSVPNEFLDELDESEEPKRQSKAKLKKRRRTTRLEEFRSIPDMYQTLEQVQAEIRRAGLESSQLIIGVDFTKSNLWTGTETFNGKSLHDCYTGAPNPYQQVLSIMGRTLQDFDDDHLIPAYGFGDNFSRDRAVLPFKKRGAVATPCKGIEEVLQRYEKIAKHVILAGPTSFAPLIYEAIKIASTERQYHILVIIADGKVDARKEETVQAIVAATLHPISIIMIGVGDGPWDTMEEFDDELPERKFDNFQFVCFNEIREGSTNPDTFESEFALAALMEIPEQYKEIQRLGLMPPPAPIQHMDAAMSAPDADSIAAASKKKRASTDWWATETPQDKYGFDESEDEDGAESACWTCSVCASENKMHETQCGVCDTSRDAAPAEAKSPTARMGSGKGAQDACTLDDEDVPTLYTCPITHDLMRDPCVADDGYTYDRSAITAWIKGKQHPLSPMTGAPLGKTFIPNNPLRSEIIAWMEEH